MKTKYPVYIISKGRWQSRLTAKGMEELNAPYRIVVEPQEYNEYSAVIDPKKILVLPFSNMGQGSIPARNWVWEHSISEGHKRHWVMDDNIRGFCQWSKDSKRPKLKTIDPIREFEDFIDRYENVPIAGLGYHFEGRVGPTEIHKNLHFQLNSRVYSCILIQNDLPLRWRGRYNEDTDLCLRALKMGYCTVNCRQIMCNKQATLTMKGGNTDQLYAKNENFDGRLEMARSLQTQHPDVVKITRKWGRWQHHVDYRPFRANRLKFTEEYLKELEANASR